MCHIPAHGHSCAEHRSQLVPYRRGDTLVLLPRLAEDPLPMEEAGGCPALPRQSLAPHLEATGRASPAMGLCILLPRRGQESTALLHAAYGHQCHSPAPQALGWTGELTIKTRKNSQTCLGATAGTALREVPLMSAGDSPWPGAALGKASGECL